MPASLGIPPTFTASDVARSDLGDASKAAQPIRRRVQDALSNYMEASRDGDAQAAARWEARMLALELTAHGEGPDIDLQALYERLVFVEGVINQGVCQ